MYALCIMYTVIRNDIVDSTPTNKTIIVKNTSGAREKIT